METPDPFRAAAARARRVQHELQEAQRFRQGDTDGDGKMDAAELMALLNLESEEEAAAIIARLDVDSDGELDLSEVGDALVSLRTKLSGAPAEPPSPAKKAAEMARAAAGMARKSQVDAQVFVEHIKQPSPPGQRAGAAGVSDAAAPQQHEPPPQQHRASLKATGYAAVATSGCGVEPAQVPGSEVLASHATLKTTGLAAYATTGQRPTAPSATPVSASSHATLKASGQAAFATTGRGIQQAEVPQWEGGA